MDKLAYVVLAQPDMKYRLPQAEDVARYTAPALLIIAWIYSVIM